MTADDKHARPGWAARLALAFAAFFRILWDPELASRFAHWHSAGALPPGKGPATPPAQPSEAPAPTASGAPRMPPQAQPAATLRTTSEEGALVLLGLLQREGRLVDFLLEDVSGADDAQVGAAARVVHEGCRRVLERHVRIEPIRSEPEGERVRIEAGYDAASVRVVGEPPEPPFEGTLLHRGWRVTEVRLPQLTEGADPRILAPAEIEV